MQMVTVEHGSEARSRVGMGVTVWRLWEEVGVKSYDDGIDIGQGDGTRDRMHRRRLAMEQVRDLAVALDLPEGVYQRAEP